MLTHSRRVIDMAISKENLPKGNVPATNLKRVTNSPRPTGAAGIPISSRPTGVPGNAMSVDSSGRGTSVGGRSYVDTSSDDEMGYGRITKVIKAVVK